MFSQYNLEAKRDNGLEFIPFPTVSAAYKPMALSSGNSFLRPIMGVMSESV